MKRFLLALLLPIMLMLMIGCAGTVKNVHDMTPSDYLTCDSNETYELVCYSEQECEDTWNEVGAKLAHQMKVNGTYVTIPFNVFEEYQSISFIGKLWVEKRNETELWMVMDTIKCDLEGTLVDEKRTERRFEGVIAP